MSGSESRAQAVLQITNSEPMSVKKPKSLDKTWATDVFTLVKMEEALSKKAFKAVKKTVETGQALDAGTADVLMGEEEVATLNSSCGAEQEYFLVDANFANLRPDLLLAGRTLFGAAPAKGQEFDDHYFGAIPPRVQVYMQDVEDQLYRLGIPAKTRHNEVAPGQFEIAPYYEAANVAADHQQLLMTTLKNTAKKHGFVCLMHEKPFAGINGSGKHVNWSVGNATQGNLLDPGTTPHSNLNFLLFCGAVIRGVNNFGPLLRAVIATAGNDHRLGANEAPPAILSVYLGTQIEGVFDQIKAGKLDNADEGGLMDMGLSQIMPFAKDAGDRNRTSPFAFTGNRFEFRAVGSDQSVTGPLIAMNTMLADSLNWIATELEAELKGNSDTTAATIAVLKKLMNENGQAVFGGDGYSSEWHEEAAKLVINMAKTAIYPAATRYLTDLAMASSSAADMGVEMDNSVAAGVAENINGMMAAVSKLEEAMAKEDHASEEEHMQFCAQTIRGLMDDARTHVDALEGVVADDLWPLPTYQEMLYIK